MDHSALLEKVNAAMERKALITLTADKEQITSGLSTGSMQLNNALSGSPFIGFVWGRIIEVFGPEQCLDSETYVRYEIRTADGKRQNHKGGTIRRLYERFHGINRKGKGNYQREISKDSKFYISSMNKENCVFQNPIADVVFTGRKECFLVRTISGKEITCTSDHKFFVGDGYQKIGNLNVGSTVFIHDNLPVTGRKKPNRYLEICVRYHPSRRKKIVTANDRNGNRKYSYIRYRVRKSHLVMEAYKNGLSYDAYISILNSDDKEFIDSFWVVSNDMCVHHKDENPRNDVIDNLELKDNVKHKKEHALKNHNYLRFKAVEDRVESIISVGYRETYDIKCFAPYNNFIADGFVVHNSGKTTLTLHCIHEAQRLEDATDKPVPCLFVDAEHAFDPKYAEAIGIDLERLGFYQPDTGEDALQAVEEGVKSGYKLIVIDSVSALTPRAEIEGGMGQSHIGLQARLMSQACRKLTGILSKSGACVIFINQIRFKIGVMFGNPETTSGGNALKFYASYRLDVRSPRGGKSTGKTLMGYGDVEDTTETGIKTKFKVVKNKLFPPYRSAIIDVEYGKGFDKIKDAISFLEYAGAFVVPVISVSKLSVKKESKKKASPVIKISSKKKLYTAVGLAKVLHEPEVQADVIALIKRLEVRE